MSTLTKSGQTVTIVPHGLHGVGRLLVICTCDRCERQQRIDRFRVLPCGCHGLVVECTCRLRDKACRSCGRVFVAAGNNWYEAIDPHNKRES